jgi:hypothetical protein
VVERAFVGRRLGLMDGERARRDCLIDWVGSRGATNGVDVVDRTHSTDSTTIRAKRGCMFVAPGSRPTGYDRLSDFGCTRDQEICWEEEGEEEEEMTKTT